MKLYVIRHGQSETNVAGCFTGWSQVNLTQKGIDDARSVRPILEGIPFDKIYSSDLHRAMQTAENAIPGCTYETTPLLREVGMGALELQPREEVLADMRRNNTAELGYAMYGGESRETFDQRVADFRHMVEGLDCENVAAFTHWGWVMELLTQILEVKIPGNNIVGNNCLVAVFEYKNDHWKLHSWINS